jgi:hypothetical protein
MTCGRQKQKTLRAGGWASRLVAHLSRIRFRVPPCPGGRLVWELVPLRMLVNYKPYVALIQGCKWELPQTQTTSAISAAFAKQGDCVKSLLIDWLPASRHSRWPGLITSAKTRPDTRLQTIRTVLNVSSSLLLAGGVHRGWLGLTLLRIRFKIFLHIYQPPWH